MAESFFGTLKNEMYSLRKWATREEARNGVIDYIERRYNRNWPHSTIDFKVPAKVMDAFFERTKPAYCALDRWRFHVAPIGIPRFTDGSFHDMPMANALSEGVDFFDYLFHHLKARSKSTGPSSKRFPKALPALPAATVLAAMQLLRAC